ncbi:unnamed protein product, partial [Didymodactylos carnosus]
ECLFSTVCFVLALWEVVEIRGGALPFLYSKENVPPLVEMPLRCLDEFDVFMGSWSGRKNWDKTGPYGVLLLTINTSNSSKQRNGISTTSHNANTKQTVENKHSSPDYERISSCTSSP